MSQRLVAPVLIVLQVLFKALPIPSQALVHVSLNPSHRLVKKPFVPSQTLEAVVEIPSQALTIALPIVSQLLFHVSFNPSHKLVKKSVILFQTVVATFFIPSQHLVRKALISSQCLIISTATKATPAITKPAGPKIPAPENKLPKSLKLSTTFVTLVTIIITGPAAAAAAPKASKKPCATGLKLLNQSINPDIPSINFSKRGIKVSFIVGNNVSPS